MFELWTLSSNFHSQPQLSWAPGTVHCFSDQLNGTLPGSLSCCNSFLLLLLLFSNFGSDPKPEKVEKNSPLHVEMIQLNALFSDLMLGIKVVWYLKVRRCDVYNYWYDFTWVKITQVKFIQLYLLNNVYKWKMLLRVYMHHWKS